MHSMYLWNHRGEISSISDLYFEDFLTFQLSAHEKRSDSHDTE